MDSKKIAILGAGNLGLSIAEGLLKAEVIKNENLVLTEKRSSRREHLIEKEFNVTTDNNKAVSESEIVIITVKPAQIFVLLNEIKKSLNKKHILVSCVTGIKSDQILNSVGKSIPLFRVMPNTGIAIQESMSCISSFNASEEQEKLIEDMFSQLGQVLFIQEDLMAAATVMAGCGIAFALRFIRAAMQGGIEIGFSSESAQTMAAQIAKGAADLVISSGHHPEREIDKVTTPSGITISGLNEMEHFGFSSSLIKGMVTSFNKIKNGE